jgi:hypothetical protein
MEQAFVFDEQRAQKYRKLPVVIDAYKTDIELTIPTDRGLVTAKQGDWVVRGTAGECYPCDANVFPTIYEPAEDKPCDMDPGEATVREIVTGAALHVTFTLDEKRVRRESLLEFLEARRPELSDEDRQQVAEDVLRILERGLNA